MLITSSGSCSTVRECRHFKKWPTPGTRNKSNSEEVRERSTGVCVEGVDNVLLRRDNFRLNCPARRGSEPSLNGSCVGETVRVQRAIARRLLLTHRRKRNDGSTPPITMGINTNREFYRKGIGVPTAE